MLDTGRPFPPYAGRPAPPAPSAFANARAALADLARLASGHVELALVEAEAAGRSLIVLVTVGVLVALALFATWTAVVAAVVMAAVERGVNGSTALLVCAAVHAAVGVALALWMRQRVATLGLPATRRQLRATLSGDSR